MPGDEQTGCRDGPGSLDNLVSSVGAIPTPGCKGESVSPMLMRDKHWCEAGINGGNLDFGRELRLAQLDKDRHTNLLLNRRHVVQAYPKLQACSQKGLDGEPNKYHRCSDTPSYPSRRTAGSYVQRQTETRNGVTPSRLSRRCLEQVVSRMPCCGKDCLRSKCPRESRGIRRRRHGNMADRKASRRITS